MTETMTITDTTDGVIATRNRISVTIDRESNVVSMKDLDYTFEEIFAIADKLRNIWGNLNWSYMGDMSERAMHSSAYISPFSLWYILWKYYIISMENNQEYNIDDEVIKVYLKVYLNAMELKKDPKIIDIIQRRMMFLVKRKRIDNN